MNEMIDRVSKVLDPDLWYPGQSAYDDQALNREMSRRRARAIIRAMREPTDEMAEVGFQHTGHPCWPKNVKEAWRAMIDEALKES